MNTPMDHSHKNGQTIHIKRIMVDSEHIRRNVTDIAKLRDTIADVGLLQPILVRQTERGYTVIDGARRLQALKELEVPELIVGRDVIVDVDETAADAKFKQLIANVQRDDVNDIELGYVFVVLKERYGYAYKEIAEIIGKTPHYVAAKVGLAKRLTPEVQELVVRDWEAAKCSRNTLSCDSDDMLDPYVMNVNVIEDIARLPPELQRGAYEAIKKKEMDKKEALRYLRGVKREAGLLEALEEAREQAEAEMEKEQIVTSREIKRRLKRLDREVEELSVSIKAGAAIDREDVVSVLEALIGRLNALYTEVKEINGISQASAQ